MSPNPQSETLTEPRTAETQEPPGRVAAAVWDWRQAAQRKAQEKAEKTRRARRESALRAVIGLAAAVLIYLFWAPVAAAVVAAIALVLPALAAVSPLGGYRRLDAAIGTFAHWVGTAVTWVALPLLYVLVFLPVGAVLRRRHLRFVRGPERDKPSYWVPRPPLQPDADDYRRQF